MDSSSRTKVAVVTGITGQDGSYLAELLLEKKGIRCLVLFVDHQILIQTVSNISLSDPI